MRARAARVGVAMVMVAAIAAAAIAEAQGQQPLRVTHLEREVDLTTQNLVVVSVMQVRNANKDPVSSFSYCFGDIMKGRDLLWIEFDEGDSGEHNGNPTTPLSWAFDEDGQCITVQLQAPLKKDKETTIELYEVYLANFVGAPGKMKQTDQQIVKFEDFDVVVDHPALDIAEQITKVTVPTPNVKHVTEVQPTTVDSNSITYGPYKGHKGSRSATLIFEYPVPLIEVESVVRNITVSSWGDIQVEEHYHIKNVGPEFESGFSRADFSLRPSAHIADTLSLRLPAGAHSLVYKDILGNITTSNARFDQSGVSVLARPRFPLVGGWQTHYQFGYKLPKSQYLRRFRGDASDSDVTSSVESVSDLPARGSNTLRMSVLPALENVLIRNLVVNVGVPEFSTVIKGGPITSSPILTAQDPVRGFKEAKTTMFSYFDVFGRPVQRLEFTNVYPDAKYNFYVSYRVGGLVWLKEPAIVGAGLLLVVLASIALNKLMDLRMIHDDEWERDQKRKGVMAQMKQVQKSASNYLKCVETMDRSLDKLRRNGDCDGALAVKQSQESILRKEMDFLREQMSTCKGLGPQIVKAEYLSTLEILLQILREHSSLYLQSFMAKVDMVRKGTDPREIDQKVKESNQKLNSISTRLAKIVSMIQP